MPVSSNIKTACALLNSRRQGEAIEVPEDIGDLALEVAEVARMCSIPNNEVWYESTGLRSFYKRPCSNVFTEFGPSYMQQKTHQHWYHVGQNYQHAASWMAQQDGSPQEGQQEIDPQLKHLHLELQQQLMQRLGGNQVHMLDSSGESGSLQTEGSSASYQDKLTQEDSNTSTPWSVAAEVDCGFAQ